MRACSYFIFCLCAAATLLARDPSGAAGLSLSELRAQLAAHVGEERFQNAQWGLKVVARDSGEVVFEHQSGKLLKPASTAKLFTGALALDVLGPEFQIRTSVYAKARPQAGVIAGDLVVYGRGDPSFSPAFLRDGRTNVFSRLIEALEGAGVREISGDLVGDSTFFSGPPFGTGWTWDDLQFYYGAEATALSVNDNSLDIAIVPGAEVGEPCRLSAKSSFVELVNRTRTIAAKGQPSIAIERLPGQGRAYIQGALPKNHGTWTESVSVPNPTLWFVTLLKEELARAGIAVKGQPRAVAYPKASSVTKEWLEIASVNSVPISEIVHRMMKVSQNLYAQLLLLQAGAAGGPERWPSTTEEAGIKRLREFVARAGIRSGEVQLDDGAGLSRSGLVTPAAMTQLLRYMSSHKAAAAYRDSLPEAGGEGSLRNRLKELKGKLQAKTGTIRYVNTLSGYLSTAAGEELVFSVMLNAYAAPPGGSNREEIDLIPRLLARLNERVGTVPAH